jgi:hypothetical protein
MGQNGNITLKDFGVKAVIGYGDYNGGHFHSLQQTIYPSNILHFRKSGKGKNLTKFAIANYICAPTKIIGTYDILQVNLTTIFPIMGTFSQFFGFSGTFSAQATTFTNANP